MTDRFVSCLAHVLREETGYNQPPGGPYVRLVHREHGPLLLDHAKGMLRSAKGVPLALPTKPDGMAFDDHPSDPGGRTGMGVLQREFDAYCRLCGKDVRDVWTITDQELAVIYREQFWEAARCEAMPPGVDLVVFDIAVNQGVGAAAKLLQRALGAKVDGHIGVSTLSDVHAAEPAALVRDISELRRQRYRGTRNFSVFGRNWMARADRVERRALQAAGSGLQTPAVAARPSADPQAVTMADASPSRAVDSAPTVAGSGTVQATTLVGGAGALTVLREVSQTAAETRDSGLVDIVMAVATKPAFLLAVLIVAGSLFVFRERVRKIWQEGI